MSACTVSEIMAVTMARLLADSRHVAVGALSPLPATAALLAQAIDPGLRVTILGSRRHNAFTDGGRELFDCAAQGRIDTFFLSGVQIDGAANINLVHTGDYARPAKRFPGSFGSAYLYSLVKKVILFKPEHTPRVLVPKVDFVSAAGVSPPREYRPGGPRHLVTGLALFDFARGRFTLRSVHPGHTAAEVARETGFEYAVEDVIETPPPTARELAALRERVRGEVAESYPHFAAKAFGG
ncbi:MAG: CoA-transferase [Gammaproteobacteria bacterium]